MLHKGHILHLRIFSLIVIIGLLFSAVPGFPTTDLEKSSLTILPQADASSRVVNTNNTAETWTVSDYQEVKGTNEVWSKNIEVRPGGILVYDNARILFDVTKSPLIINVSSGGTLKIINGSLFDLKELPDCKGYFIESHGELIIENSTISYAGYTTLPNASGCNSPPIQWNYGPGLWLSRGTAVINGSTIRNSTYGILLQDAELELNGGTFMNNFYAIYCYESNGFKINGVKFDGNFYAIFAVTSTDLELNDCFFENNYFGIFLEKSKFALYNSTIQIYTGGGILAYHDSELTVAGSVLSSAEDSYPEKYNVFLEDSKLVMTESLSANGLWGLYLQNCSADITNTELLDNEFAGIYAFQTDVDLTNCTVFGSNFGILLENTTSTLDGNSIIDNSIGVMALRSSPMITNNLITRNSEYGVEGQDSDFALGTGNTYTDTESKTNGKGILRLSCNVYVRVFDQHGNLLAFVDARVTDNTTQEVFNDTLYIKGDYFGGKITLTRKWIDNSGASHDEGPYSLEVFWGKPEWGRYVTTSTAVICKEGEAQQVSLTLKLPDLYLLGSEFRISSTRPGEGDTVDVTIPVHTTGTLSPTDTDVTIYVNDKYTTVRTIDSFGGKQTYDLVVPLEVEADAQSGKFRVRAEVENKNYEVNYYLQPYSSNNSATTIFDVKLPDEDDEADGLSYGIKFAFFALAIIVFLIVVVLVMKVFFAAKPADSDKDGESEEDENGGGGGGKPREIKVEPPEMVRKL